MVHRCNHQMPATELSSKMLGCSAMTAPNLSNDPKKLTQLKSWIDVDDFPGPIVILEEREEDSARSMLDHLD